jgi:hypothetical protein
MKIGRAAAVLFVGVATTASLVAAAQGGQQGRVLASRQRDATEDAGPPRLRDACSAQLRLIRGTSSGTKRSAGTFGPRGRDGERFQAKVGADAPLRMSLASAAVRKTIWLHGRGARLEEAVTPPRSSY